MKESEPKRAAVRKKRKKTPATTPQPESACERLRLRVEDPASGARTRRLPPATEPEKPGPVTFIGEPGTEQYLLTRVDGKLIAETKLHDPFLMHTVNVRGFQYAWKALFGGLKIQVSLHGTDAIQHAIFMLDPCNLPGQEDARKALAASTVNSPCVRTHADTRG